MSDDLQRPGLRFGDGRAPLTLADLPPDAAARLEFDRAVPTPLRRRLDRLDPVVADAFRRLWDVLAAEAYDELQRKPGNGPWRLRRSDVDRVLERLQAVLVEAQALAVVAGVRHPVAGGGRFGGEATASGTAALVTAAEQLALYGSWGAAAAGAVAAAVFTELFDSYVAASVRTRQYAWAHRSPSPATVAADLDDALAGRRTVDRVAGVEAATAIAHALANRLARRVGRRFTAGIALGGGVAWSAAVSWQSVSRVRRRPLRAPDEWEAREGNVEDEVFTPALDWMGDTPAP